MSGGARAGGGSFDAAQRRRLAAALRAGGTLPCPACGAELARRRVEPPGEVAYVRHRVLLVCPDCHRAGGFDDVSAAAPP